jgi:hypothetical protein
MFYLSKNKWNLNQETKNDVILSVGNVHRVQRCVHSLFSSSLLILISHCQFSFSSNILQHIKTFCLQNTSRLTKLSWQNVICFNFLKTSMLLSLTYNFIINCDNIGKHWWIYDYPSAMTTIQTFPHVWCNPVKSFRSDRKRFTRRDIVDLFGTGASRYVSLNSFWRVK